METQNPTLPDCFDLSWEDPVKTGLNKRFTGDILPGTNYPAPHLAWLVDGDDLDLMHNDRFACSVPFDPEIGNPAIYLVVGRALVGSGLRTGGIADAVSIQKDLELTGERPSCAPMINTGQESSWVLFYTEIIPDLRPKVTIPKSYSWNLTSHKIDAFLLYDGFFNDLVMQPFMGIPWF